MRFRLITGLLLLWACFQWGCDPLHDLSNYPPQISIKNTEPIHSGSAVVLDASKSWDPEADTLRFTWSVQTPSFNFQAQNSVASMNTDGLEPGLVFAQLSVTDGINTVSAQVPIIIVDENEPIEIENAARYLSAMSILNQYHYRKPNYNTLAKGSIQSMIDSLNDPWAEYLTGYTEGVDANRDFAIQIQAANTQTNLTTRIVGITGIIKINHFKDKSAADEFRKKALEIQSQGITQLIIDLRNNRGGYVSQALAIADLFIPKGKILIYRQGNAGTIACRSQSDPIFSKEKVVVLINQNTASSAEILSAALQCNDRAALIGVPSYGKGLCQIVFSLDDGYAVKISTNRILDANGHSYDQIGLTPDLRVSPLAGNSQDNQLVHAVAWFKK